jgi:hypothetical protein
MIVYIIPHNNRALHSRKKKQHKKDFQLNKKAGSYQLKIENPLKNEPKGSF